MSKELKNQKLGHSGLIPYIFFIFFGVVFIVNFTYIYIAKKTSRGIYTENSYKKGINYNETINEVKKQQELGWKFDIKYQKNDDNAAIISVILLDKNNRPIKNAKIIGKLKRPTQTGFDFEQEFLFENNKYIAKINFPLKGVWDVEIIAFSGDNVVQEVKRYIIK